MLDFGSLYAVKVEGAGAWRSVGALMMGDGHQLRVQSGIDSSPSSPRFTVYVNNAEFHAPARLRRSEYVLDVYCDGVLLKSATVFGATDNWQVEVSLEHGLDLMVCGIYSLPSEIMLETVSVAETAEGTVVIL